MAHLLGHVSTLPGPATSGGKRGAYTSSASGLYTVAQAGSMDWAGKVYNPLWNPFQGHDKEKQKWQILPFPNQIRAKVFKAKRAILNGNWSNRKICMLPILCSKTPRTERPGKKTSEEQVDSEDTVRLSPTRSPQEERTTLLHPLRVADQRACEQGAGHGHGPSQH